MYTYNEASKLAHQAQDQVFKIRTIGIISDSDEVFTALHDSGYLMGLMRAGAPIEDQSFQLACAHLDNFINQYTED